MLDLSYQTGELVSTHSLGGLQSLAHLRRVDNVLVLGEQEGANDDRQERRFCYSSLEVMNESDYRHRGTLTL